MQKTKPQNISSVAPSVCDRCGRNLYGLSEWRYLKLELHVIFTLLSKAITCWIYGLFPYNRRSYPWNLHLFFHLSHTVLDPPPPTPFCLFLRCSCQCKLQIHVYRRENYSDAKLIKLNKLFMVTLLLLDFNSILQVIHCLDLTLTRYWMTRWCVVVIGNFLFPMLLQIQFDGQCGLANKSHKGFRLKMGHLPICEVLEMRHETWSNPNVLVERNSETFLHTVIRNFTRV